MMTSSGLKKNYSQCQNYRTEPGVQKYGKIPYLRTPPDPDSARIRKIPYLRTPPDPDSARIRKIPCLRKKRI